MKKWDADDKILAMCAFVAFIIGGAFAVFILAWLALGFR